MWGDLVPKLIENSAESIIHQRAAKNIGLQWDYLVSESRHFGTLLRLEYFEIFYKNIVYNGYGEVVNTPVNVLIPEAFPQKKFRVTEFEPSGLQGYLKMFLPPYTSPSPFRRNQQILALIGATGNLT